MDNYLKTEFYELIKKDESIFEFIQRDSLDGLWYWDLEQPENEWMNERFWEILGYNSNEIPYLANTWQDIINPDDLKVSIDNFTKHIEEPDYNYDQIVRYKHKTGSTVWIRCRGMAIRDKHGKAVRMLGTHMDITQLKETEEKFRAVVDNSPFPIAIVDEKDNNVIYWSKSGLQLFGHNPKTSEEWFELAYPNKEYQQQVKARWKPFLDIARQSNAVVNTGEYDIHCKNGTVIICEIYAQFVSNFLLITLNDVTKRKQAENEIKLREKHLLSLVENPAGYIIYRTKLNRNTGQIEVVQVSPSFTDILGITENVKNNFQAWFTHVHPEELPLLLKTNEEGMKPPFKLNVEIRYNHPEKGWRWLDIRSTGIPFDDDPNLIEYANGLILDITERKETEEKLKESENRLKEAQKLSKIGNWELDLTKNRLHWSDEIYRIFDCNPQEFKATYEAFLEHIHPDDRQDVEEAYKKHLVSKKPYNIVHRLLLSGNKTKFVREQCTTNFDKQGNALISKGTVADITKQIEYQQELVIAKEKAEEANRLKTEFLQNMSHEIRTPMNGIVGFSDMLGNSNLSNEEREYYASIVRNCSMQLLKIIDDILEISTLETNQTKLNEETFFLNDFIMQLFSVFDLQSKKQNISMYVKKALPDNKSQIITDKSKLFKILSNLLENALKFTSQGYIEFGYYITEPDLIIYVKDTGIGVSSENKERIFDRFSQENKDIAYSHGGLGLGLSISKKNTQLLGGDITIESKKGKGSTFFVTIPYRTSSNSENETAVEPPTILVAEDEEVNFLYIEALFKKETGEKVNLIHAKNGKEAVDMYIRNKNINLILMDIKMPIMDGYEAIEKIKSNNPSIPIIAQTAYSTESEKQLALKHGCDDFISKPLNKETFFKLINKYLKAS